MDFDWQSLLFKTELTLIWKLTVLQLASDKYIIQRYFQTINRRLIDSVHDKRLIRVLWNKKYVDFSSLKRLSFSYWFNLSSILAEKTATVAIFILDSSSLWMPPESLRVRSNRNWTLHLLYTKYFCKRFGCSAHCILQQILIYL